MVLLQISEPSQSPDPHQRRLAVGIDLGTTNSLVAKVIDGKPQVLKDIHGQSILPSVVLYSERGDALVGIHALERLSSDAENTIASVKRLMGKGLEDLEAYQHLYQFEDKSEHSLVPKIKTQHVSVTPVEVSSEILKALKCTAEHLYDAEIMDAVITVPAYFDDAQRQATKDAAKLAGLTVLRLINEPTAAAIAYGLDKKSEGVVAVYDLGGGTFDVSILKIRKGVFEVLATSGDTDLGGDDLDYTIVQYLIEKFSLSDVDRKTHRHLSIVARQAKELLTTNEVATVNIELEKGMSLNCDITRSEFNTLIKPLLKRTLTPCRRALSDAGLKTSDINSVILVGGSTRVPLVKEMISEFFGQECLSDINPEQVVALGAAIQADALSGNQLSSDLLLLDVIPLSLGIETMGGLVEKIIHRNSTIPVAKAQEFTTYKDGQTAMMIHVLQGERELVSDCRSLAKFELKGIPPMVAGAARIEVQFQVDADGLLSVSAKETSTEVEASVTVKPSFGLSDEEIASMLTDSMQYAQKDMENRRLREQQTEAARVIEALDSALKADGEDLLSKEELQSILLVRDQLAELSLTGSYLEIKSAIEHLELASRQYVGKRIDININKVLSGQHVDEYKQPSK